MSINLNGGVYGRQSEPDLTPIVREYPLKALPQRMLKAALHFSAQNLIHPVLPAMASIGVASIVAQSLACFKMPGKHGRRRPASLFMAVIAPPGSGKTTTADSFLESIRTHDQEVDKPFEEACFRYSIDYGIWKGLRKELGKALSEAIMAGKPSEHLEERLRAHDYQRPRKPQNLRFLYEDITNRPLVTMLRGNGRSLALASDDAKAIFDNLHRMLGHLNQCWDGTPIAFDRAEESVTANDQRVAMLLMTQRSVFDDFQMRHGELAKGMGHWGRYLIAVPPKLSETQYPDGDACSSAFDDFHERIYELLSEYVRRVREGHPGRDDIELAEDACRCWQAFASEMKTRSADGGDLRDIDDFASKAAEHAGRLATVFAVFDKESRITLDTIERAIEIVRYHLEEYRDCFSLASMVPEVVCDAETLENYLKRLYSPVHRLVPKSHIQKNGPKDLRDLKRLDAALNQLSATGRVGLRPGSKRSCLVEYFPRIEGSR